MIEIKPAVIDDEIKSFAGCNFDENTFVMAAKDKDDLLGIGIIRLYKDYAVFADVKFSEEYKMLGLDYSMGKSMLNFIERRGIYDTYADSNIDSRLLKSLGFEQNKKEQKFDYFLDLEGYFNVNCHC